MIVAASGDLIPFALAVGFVIWATSALAVMNSRSRSRRSQKAPTTAVGVVSTSAILARASAVAREQASRSTAGYHLDSVRPAGVRGQIVRAPDSGGGRDRDERRAWADAIVVHMAENDPQRMAEVITEWIRTDTNRNGSGSR
jgi:hypothetical protein